MGLAREVTTGTLIRAVLVEGWGKNPIGVGSRGNETLLKENSYFQFSDISYKYPVLNLSTL